MQVEDNEDVWRVQLIDLLKISQRCRLPLAETREKKGQEFIEFIYVLLNQKGKDQMYLNSESLVRHFVFRKTEVRKFHSIPIVFLLQRLFILETAMKVRRQLLAMISMKTTSPRLWGPSSHLFVKEDSVSGVIICVEQRISIEVFDARVMLLWRQLDTCSGNLNDFGYDR